MPATQTDRLYGMTTSVAVKPPCRVATTGPITASGEQTINGVAVVTGDRVLRKNEVDTTQNGIWIADTSAWQRSPDFDGSLDAVNGTIVLVQDASSPGTIYELQATNPVIIGTSALVFNLSSNQPAATFAAWGGMINSATGKTTPVDADAFAMMDSAAGNATKKLTWANLKATLKTYFDTLYAVVGAFAAKGANTDITSLGNNTSTIYTTAGTSTAYTITPTPAIAAYAAGQSFVVNFNAASGASPTLQISGIATPPNLVEELSDGTFTNIIANRFPANHRSRVTLISSTQALVEKLPNIFFGTSVATTSGTSIDITGIPASANLILVPFNAVSTNGTASVIVQGGSGSVDTSGYLGSAVVAIAGASSAGNLITNGFGISGSTAAVSILHGVLTLTRQSGNTWVGSFAGAYSQTAATSNGAGTKTFAGALDRIRLTTTAGVDTFDGGSINYMIVG